MQVPISRFVQAVNLSWCHPWMDHGEHSVVAPPSAQVWLHYGHAGKQKSNCFVYTKCVLLNLIVCTYYEAISKYRYWIVMPLKSSTKTVPVPSVITYVATFLKLLLVWFFCKSIFMYILYT